MRRVSNPSLHYIFYIMIYRGIIFDLDGTLADTLTDIADSMNRVLKVRGFPVHPVEDYRYLIGRGLENLVTSSLPKESRLPSIITACLASLLEDYRANCLVHTHLYPGIESLLFHLQEMGLKLAVFSNKADDLTQIIVKFLLPGIRFGQIVGARPDYPKKPDPSGARLISSFLRLSPEQIIYLGDSDVDMQTARGASMLAVGVLWGFRTKEELLLNGADHLLSDPSELLTLLEN
jgi:phosphoglycolate phosphatase